MSGLTKLEIALVHHKKSSSNLPDRQGREGERSQRNLLVRRTLKCSDSDGALDRGTSEGRARVECATESEIG